MSMSVPGNSCRTNRCFTPITAGCTVRVYGECVFYSGSNLSGPGINTGDSFNTVVNDLVNYISTSFISYANNGLSVSSNTVQLGQSVGDVANPAILLSNREVPTGGFSLLFTGTGRVAIGTTSPNSTHKFTSVASGTDRAIHATAASGIAINGSSAINAIIGQSTGTGISVQGITVGAGIGVQGSSGVGGIGGKFTSVASGGTADPVSLELQRDATGVGVTNGVGQTIMFRLPFSNSAPSNESGRITNYFSNAASGAQSSNFGFYLMNSAISARKMLIANTGQITLDEYGNGNFTGTPAYTLQVDSSGNVIEGSVTPSVSNSVIPFISADFDPDGITVTDATLNGRTFELFLNDLNRFIYNEVGNQEWDYVVGGGFQILLPGFDANTIDYHLYLFPKT